MHKTSQKIGTHMTQHIHTVYCNVAHWCLDVQRTSQYADHVIRSSLSALSNYKKKTLHFVSMSTHL